MAHELEIIDGKAQMFFTGETPWHGMGTRVDGLLTASEALKASGLDWTADKVPAWDRLPNGEFVQIPGKFSIRRSSDNKILGTGLGGDYNVLQNADAFDFFDAIVDSGEAKYETAGSLFGGKRVWLTAKLPTMTVCGEDHDMYLLFSNSHDGSRAFTAATTMIRAVCNNTVTMGIQGAKTKWSLNHKKTLEGKVGEARAALQLAFKNGDKFAEEVEKLMLIPTDKDQFESIVRDLLPKQKRQLDKNVESLVGIFESEPTIVDTEAAGTAWGAYNAVTFWLDHGREVRSEEARMTSLMDGFGARLRNQTHERLLALV